LKRFILPLLAALALPTAVNAESYWLVLIASRFDSPALEKIEMSSTYACEQQGRAWKEEGKYFSY